jgi:hypothetical protein
MDTPFGCLSFYDHTLLWSSFEETGRTMLSQDPADVRADSRLLEAPQYR